ncbi:MAG: hypothetical protein ACRD02_06255 [Acidimicrobiia bacterium]
MLFGVGAAILWVLWKQGSLLPAETARLIFYILVAAFVVTSLLSLVGRGDGPPDDLPPG